MNKPFLLALPLFLGVAAQAQVLPAPAPQPVKPITKATPVPEPLIQDPPSTESPIIIGEPVRHQNTAPAAPKTAPATTVSRASVAGVSIAGLTDGNAVAKLRDALSPQLKQPVRLVVGTYQYTYLRDELGTDLPLWPMMRDSRQKNSDVPLRLQVDQDKLLAALKDLDTQVRADFTDTGLNVGASVARVKAGLEATPIPAAITLVTITLPKTAPVEKTQEDAAIAKKDSTPTGKFPYLIATFSTHYDASLRGRTTNLRMAATHIDGTIVQPGKVFSANEAIGPRSSSAGWREAKMFVSGQVVSGTGAGICQAASTLYNAALLANVPIIERHAHSMRVMYVPPSRDAALMWGSKDFKFRNNTGGALKVQTFVSGGKFHVNMWGSKPRTSEPVKIVSHVISRVGGTKSEAFKYVGDQKIRLSRDSYKPHP